MTDRSNRRSMFLLLAVLSLAVVASACGSPAATPPPHTPTASPTSTPFPTSTMPAGTVAAIPTPTPAVTSTRPPATGTPAASPHSVTRLKYKLLERYPDFFFCDPDFYPIAREDEQVLADRRFPDLQKEPEEFSAILEHLKIAPAGSFTGEQRLAVYREHKKLNAVLLEQSGSGYRFNVRTSPDEVSGKNIEGLISTRGEISVTKEDETFVTCPICLSENTMIATPGGNLRVQDLRAGMQVWTRDTSGARIAVPVLQTGFAVSAPGQMIMHLTLDDGRELYVSTGHPTADGRQVGGLQRGDSLDGSLIVRFEQLPYAGDRTYDILPAGGTGFYWANGILMGSTLAR